MTSGPRGMPEPIRSGRDGERRPNDVTGTPHRPVELNEAAR